MDLEGGNDQKPPKNGGRQLHDHDNHNDQNHRDGRLHDNHLDLRVVKIILLLCSVIVVSALALNNSSYTFQILSTSFYKPSSPLTANSTSPVIQDKLEIVLRKAAMADKTVIVTSLNDAWAEPNSIFDVFLESFKIGNGTQKYLEHLVVIALDQKAYNRCLTLHPHCYALTTDGVDFSEGEAFFMTANYLKLVMRKIEVLQSVLERGYNFVFTDCDIMWLRDPFPRFFADVDLQVACDQFRGNSSGENNSPNTGLMYVKSNNRTIKFYEYWNRSKETYPESHDQDVFNHIKYESYVQNDIGLGMRFLDTTYFGGFCEPSKDFNKVCTMHANCCVGLKNKMHDLGVVLEDWRNYMALSMEERVSKPSSWRIPQSCR